MGRALITDLYELNMTVSFLRRGMTDRATFSLFVRNLPRDRGFLVAAGLEDCLDYLDSLAFTSDELEWLGQNGFQDADVRALSAFRFSGDVRAVPEGSVLLAGEPLLEVTAPLPEAQLVETYLLNQVTFQTAIATKAARCTLAAGDMRVVDFALRRTHGTDAGRGVARASAIAGFAGTSNVDAARRYGLAMTGTMAHSYIEAFSDEQTAFEAFSQDFPGRTTFLVDTYDTLEGVRHAIDVIQERRLTDNLAIRLDSGNLADLARKSRALLDAAGLPNAKIFVSGGLDEYDLEALRRSGAPIDGAGVGTVMGVSADAPYLDSVYKLVQVGDRPVAKLSTGKATLPGPKQIWRGPSGQDDVLSTADERGPAGHRPLLVKVMAGGSRTGKHATIDDARRRYSNDLAGLPASARAIKDPVAPVAGLSQQLRMLNDQVVAALKDQTGKRVSD